MKTYFTFLFFFLLVLSSCADLGEMKKLSEIESLKSQHPDSALFLLETSFAPSIMNDKTLGRWCLLTGALCDSLGKPIDITPDLFESTAEYYKHENRPNLQASAYYYLGRTFFDRKDYDRAIEVYTEAIDIAQEAGEHNLTGYIYNGIANIYRQRIDIRGTIFYYEQAVAHFLKAGNFRNYIAALHDLGEMEIQLEKFDKALYHLSLADSLALVYKDSILIATTKERLGLYYSRVRNYDLAEKTLLESSAYLGKMSRENRESLFDIYLERGDYVRADSIISLYLSQENGSLLSSYWYKQYLLAEEKGDKKQQLESLLKYEKYSDRVWETKDSLRTAELTQKYDYSKIVEENTILAYESRNRLMWIFFWLAICLAIYVIYQYNVIKKNKELQRKHQEIEFEKNKKKEQELKLKEQELEFKEKALNFRKQKDELEMKINRETETKQGLLKGSLMFKKINMLSEFSTRNSAAFRAEVEKVMSSSTLSEDDWRDIKNEINCAYPDFTIKLSQEITRLTEEEIRFCCLLKAGLETSELAVLLNITSQSVNKRRSRINKKIREVYPDSSWSNFLYNL